MTITVTLSPSLDRAVELAHLAPGCVQRVTAASLDPGGKGMNVALVPRPSSCPEPQMPGPADIDRPVVHILSDPLPALTTPTEGES